MEFIKYFVFSQDRFTLLIELFTPVFMIGMIIYHAIVKKRKKEMKIWRILSVIPVIISIIHLSLYNFKGSFDLTLKYYFAVYISGLCFLIWSFTAEKKIIYRILTPVLLLAVTFSGLYNISSLATADYKITNHSHESYTASFKSTLDDLKENYCLNEWKQIDYEELENTLMPKVVKAEEENDSAAYYMALCELTYYFYDSHVGVKCLNQNYEADIQARECFAGNDYGFSMITLTSGETVAVFVDEDSEAYKAGIRTNTVITKWDGIDIDEAKKSVNCIYPIVHMPIKENEDKLKAAFLAGKGGDTVQVTFINEKNETETVTLSAIGTYDMRLEGFLIAFFCDSAYNTYKAGRDNFYTKMLTSECGYMVVTNETYDNMLDIKATFSGEYPEVTKLVDEKLEDLKSQGMKKLIIDTRGNGGGLDAMSAAIATLFTDKKFFNYSLGKYKNGDYIAEKGQYIKGNGKWKDLEVVVLTNAGCMSAGDQLVNLMGLGENVTLMGTTSSSGVNQNNGGLCVTTDSMFAVYYPAILTLGEDGKPLIDPDKERENRIPLDVSIPITKEYVESVFNTDTIDRYNKFGEDAAKDDYIDYELQYAIDFLEDNL